MKKLIFTIMALLIASPAFAGGYVLVSPDNQTAQSLSASDAAGLQEILRSTSGALHVTSTAGVLIDPTNAVVDIPSVGVADRVQMPDLDASYCTIQAPMTNASYVYVGGSTVTNSSGANEGIELVAGSAISNIRVSNLDKIYVAADVAGDDVKYICN